MFAAFCGVPDLGRLQNMQILEPINCALMLVPHRITGPLAESRYGRCRMHGGPSPGAPKGNRNAWKHGRFSPEAIARRREVGLWSCDEDHVANTNHTTCALYNARAVCNAESLSQ